MAEEQVMSQESLVLDGNMESLAKRIKNVESALADELLDRQKTAFCKLFLQLCKQYFQFRSFDLLEITDSEELLTLESEVFKRAERGYKLTKYVGMPLLALIPMFGWELIYDMLECCNSKLGVCDYIGFYNFRYYKLRRILMKTEGKDFFPFEALKQILQS